MYAADTIRSLMVLIISIERTLNMIKSEKYIMWAKSYFDHMCNLNDMIFQLAK